MQVLKSHPTQSLYVNWQMKSEHVTKEAFTSDNKTKIKKKITLCDLSHSWPLKE